MTGVRASPSGVVLLQLPQDLAIPAVVGVVDAAVDAGYADASFMVNDLARSAGAPRIARLSVEAFMSIKRARAANVGGELQDLVLEERVIHVEVAGPEKYTLLWKEGYMVISTVDVPRSDERRSERGGATVYDLPELAAKVQSEWNVVGVHRAETDGMFDHAVIHLPPTATHAYLIGVMDAVLRSKRSFTVDAARRTCPRFASCLPSPGSPSRLRGTTED